MAQQRSVINATLATHSAFMCMCVYVGVTERVDLGTHTYTIVQQRHASIHTPVGNVTPLLHSVRIDATKMITKITVMLQIQCNSIY